MKAIYNTAGSDCYGSPPTVLSFFYKLFFASLPNHYCRRTAIIDIFQM